MSERKHADLWNELVDEAGEDAIERAAAVSVAQAEAELKAAGFDVAAERAKAGALLEPPRAAEATRTKKRRPAVIWLAPAALAAAGVALVAVQLSPGPAGSPPPRTSAPPAAELRHDAAVACDAKQWSVCLSKLDEARAVDPEGDAVPEVKSLRDKAMTGSRDGR